MMMPGMQGPALIQALRRVDLQPIAHEFSFRETFKNI
jgi:hypothetical protein